MKKNIIILIISLCLTILCALSLFERINLSLQDSVFQKRGVTSSDIVLVGIDEKAFDILGPYQEWNRDIMARAVEYLNKSDDSHPAVICLDILYAGQRDADADSYLVEACSKYDNVITASVATFGADLVEESDGEISFYNDAILAYEEAFGELRAVTTPGAINAMLDEDGILRHHCLKLDLPDGNNVDSMVLSAAKKYAQSRELPLVIPTDERFWYVPYTGMPGDYSEGISIADLLLEEIPADYFADKIVFIGPYAAGMQDGYFTAISHTDTMYGIEYQANALQAMLEGNYKKELPAFPQYILLFALLLSSLYIYLNKKFAISTVVWCGELFIYVGLVKLLYELGFILDVLYVPLCLSIAYLGCIIYNYIHSVIEKKKVTNTFKRYVAPEVVNEILKEGADSLELGGKVENIAVLFVDVRGFTTMSEMLEPTQVVHILNDYLTLIADCIIKNGGTLDKFVGDCAMAIWGAPIKCDDYVMKAVQAASDMVSGSQDLSKLLLEKYGRSVSFGIGVHVGEAVVGNMGSPMRMDYTAIGDTVNTAARLEANAPAGTIYISRDVADILGDRIKTTSLGDSIKLKGKKDGFEVLVMEEIV